VPPLKASKKKKVERREVEALKGEKKTEGEGSLSGEGKMTGHRLSRDNVFEHGYEEVLRVGRNVSLGSGNRDLGAANPYFSEYPDKGWGVKMRSNASEEQCSCYQRSGSSVGIH